MAIIPRNWNNNRIRQREDNYISATDMCTACGKLFADWKRQSSTEEYLQALSSVMGIPITAQPRESQGLIEVKQGGKPDEQGTWVHRKIAIRLAQWLSPEFAIQVDNWVEELLLYGHTSTNGGNQEHNKGAYWYERSKLAFSSLDYPLPCGYFSTYEYIIKLFQEMELYLGYVMPDFNPATNKYVIPDISIGKRFNTWLRDNEDAYASWCREYYLGSPDPIDFRKPDHKNNRPEGKNYSEIVQYEHIYPVKSHGEYTSWMVNAYPNRYKALFETFFSMIWLPIQFPKYLKQRDHAFLDEVKQKYNNLPDRQKKSLSATHIGKLIPALPSS